MEREDWMKCLTCMSFDPDDETCDHLMKDVDPEDYCDAYDPGDEQ